MRDVLIIGGGPAGIAAAETLLRLGKKITVIDRGPFGGGVPIELSCKGAVECTRCHVCMPRDAAKRIRYADGMDFRPMSSMKSASVKEDGISVQLEQAPRHVRSDRCIGCGRCVAVCPVPGAIIPPPHGALANLPYIDPSRCAHFGPKRCDLCAQVCPTGAIRFRERSKLAYVSGRAVVLAPGLEPIDPSGVMQYGYGLLPDVLTSLDAERIIASYGELRRPSDGVAPKSLAVIQCAGSRTVKGGAEYCSEFCCKYGIRLARALSERTPDLELAFLYMDLRTFESRKEALEWTSGRNGVSVLQGVPGIVQGSSDGKLLVRHAPSPDQPIQEREFDMVILSVGGMPRPETRLLAEIFSVKSDQHGFLELGDRDRGVFVAGSCRAPMDIEEAMLDGHAVALEVARNLEVVR